MNYNQVLGVSSDASGKEIKQAFRKAALEIHPDHSNSPEAAEAFARIKEAYDELIKKAEAAKPKETVQQSTAAAVRATSNAAFATTLSDDLFDGMTPEEVAHIQMLDRLALKKPRFSLFRRHKESEAVRRHRKKLKTNDRRLNGKY